MLGEYVLSVLYGHATMHLLSVGMWGYRRFREERPNMDVSAQVVAIVGPNEAGKTSFLKGLLHLNEDGTFQPNEYTRHGNRQVCVRCTVGLDDDDRAELADLHRGLEARTVSIWKREGGTLTARVDPKLARNLEPRRGALKALERVSTLRWAQSTEGFASIAAALRGPLSSDDETLADEQVETLRHGRQTLADLADPPASVQRLLTVLDEALVIETGRAPAEEAAERLLARRPQFLFFEAEHRTLEPIYNLGETPSTAMENLLALADLDLASLRSAAGANDEATVEELLVAANNRLRAVFSNAWSQARITVRLRHNGSELHILVSSTPRRFVSIAERSDGLRQFVALVAYIERFASRPNLVLLIDEAETHLHYDAQADLVKVLTNQTIAGKVIYTTHSAGCLPEDLGVGVRMIEPTGPSDRPREEWEHSQVQNRFWTSNSKGGAYSPLLMAMGATALAFSATRFALVAEGLTDAMVLPTLFREAVAADSLGFQIAPGIAEAGHEALAQLDLTAAKVAYLVDSDEQGDRHRERLIEAGVSPQRILRLGRARQGLSMEDLLDRAVYIAAVNAELKERHGVQIPSSQIPEISRSAAVEKWCRSKKIDGRTIELSKRAVAQRVLERRSETQLLSDARLALVRTLHEQVAALLELK